MDNNTACRWIGVFIAVGGVLGVAMTAALAMWQEYQGRNGLGLLLLLLPHGWAALCGTRLFQQTAYGLRWAPVVLALQTPVINAGGFMYDWWGGFALIPYMELGQGKLALNFKLRLGEGGEIFYGMASPTALFGLNVVALGCLIVLLWQRRKRRLSADPAALRP